MIKLYDYYRSSAAYRVRIALFLKEIPHELMEIHLVKDGGEQHKVSYEEINPLKRVPTLIDGDFTLTQSLAILAYLNEKYPDPPLLPKEIQKKTQILSFSQIIACDIHPLNNLSVLQYLENELEVNQTEKSQWYHHWIHGSFKAIEKQLKQTSGNYSFGDEITLADLFLIPQVYNAYRFKVDMTEYSNISRIYEACNQLDAFKKAHPDAILDQYKKSQLTSKI